jgi:hypothetical protein
MESGRLLETYAPSLRMRQNVAKCDTKTGVLLIGTLQFSSAIRIPDDKILLALPTLV